MFTPIKEQAKKGKPKKLSEIDKAVNRINDALFGGKTKVRQTKEPKHKPPKSMFDDIDEDNGRYSDYGDLGIDIPRGDDW